MPTIAAAVPTIAAAVDAVAAADTSNRLLIAVAVATTASETLKRSSTRKRMHPCHPAETVGANVEPAEKDDVAETAGILRSFAAVVVAAAGATAVAMPH